jgi:hypothetical protein
MVDIPFPVPVGCAATDSAETGGSCNLTTSATALMPGMIKDGDRQVMQLGQVRVDDGGPDGNTATEDNDLFAVQGLFVPWSRRAGDAGIEE